jgi:hypothetical protein
VNADDVLRLYNRIGGICHAIEYEPAGSEKARAAREQLRIHASIALKDLSDLSRKRYEAGDRTALMGTLFMYSNAGDFVLPQWVQQALYDAVIGQPKSWDDVFGRPRKNTYEVAFANREALKLRAEGYKKDDNSLFPELAKRMNKTLGTNISSGTAKNRCYEVPRDIAKLLWPFEGIPADDVFDRATWGQLSAVLIHIALCSKISGIKLE